MHVICRSLQVGQVTSLSFADNQDIQASLLPHLAMSIPSLLV